MRSHVVQAAVRPQHESGIRMVPSVTVTTGVLNDDDRLPGSGEIAPLARRGASKEVSSDGEHLKNQLEAELT